MKHTHKYRQQGDDYCPFKKETGLKKIKNQMQQLMTTIPDGDSIQFQCGI
jgi:hypothetical protein